MLAGKFFVTDAHCHIYPDRIAPLAVAGTDRFYGEKSLYKGTVTDLLEKGEQAGIDRFVVQSVATTPHQVKSINEFIAAEVAAHPGKLIGLGTLHPDSADQAGDMEHLRELGLHGVKLHPDIQQFKIDDYRCLKIYELCERYGLPILMHTGDKRFDYSNPNRLLPVLKIYTNLTVIGAHFGGWSVWEQAVEAFGDLQNLYVDCSSTFPFTDRETFGKLLTYYGAGRVLFGTDYPMWSQKRELENLLSLGLSDEDLQQILNTNVSTIFHLE
ncbi:MAG: amidohydrolase [Clostridia bacterium]|nr:amidohydrolase [Clostridia bacterium]